MKRQFALESTDDVPRIVFDLTPVMAESLERTSKSRYELRLNNPSHRIKNWSLSENFFVDAMWFTEPLNTITLSIVALVYGGLHLLAWNAPFHTRIEETLWKISGIFVASIGPMSIAYAGLLSVTDKLFRHIGPWPIIVEKINQFFGVSYLLFYLFARVYLVVECFIEVAYLPDSAFTTPVFTRYIPHFG